MYKKIFKLLSLVTISGVTLLSVSTVFEYQESLITRKKQEALGSFTNTVTDVFHKSRFLRSYLFDEEEESYYGGVQDYPLFSRLTTSEKNEFARIVSGGKFSADIQKTALNEKFYPFSSVYQADVIETRSKISLIIKTLKKALLWVGSVFGWVGVVKAMKAAEHFAEWSGGNLKDFFTYLLVDYLRFNRTFALWLTRLVFFIFDFVF